ncbi:ATP-binding protein [Chloroflexota bacterium]
MDNFQEKIKVVGSDATSDLNNNISQPKQTNEELLRRATELSKVNEITLGIASVKSINEVYELVVESAVDIPGVRFVIVNQIDESGEFLITPYFSKIRNQTVKTALKKIGFDLEKQLGRNPTSRKLQLPIAKLKLAEGYLSNRRTIVKERFSEMLDGCWSKKLCDTIQKIAGFKKFVIIPLITKTEPNSTIVFHLDDDVPQNVLETIVAHCALAINNVGTLEKLRRSEDQYRLISENTSDVITLITFDLNPVFLYVSPSIQAYGYEPEELIGKHCFDLIHLDDKKQLLSLLQHYIAQKVEGLLTGKESPIVETIEFRAKDKSGNWHHLSGTTNLAGNQILIINRDITERKQADEKIDKLYQNEMALREKLEAEMEKRSEFAKMLVHELKTPLTPMIAASDLLLENIPEGSLFRLARSINQGAETLSSRINMLVDIAKGETGTLKIVRTETDVLDLLQRISEDTNPLAYSRNQVLNVELPRSLPKVSADGERIRQVVVNLLDNSSKFTPEGGKITLRAEEKNDAIIVEVKDTGPGIPVDQQQHLFETQYYVSVESRYGRGLGLGLAISRMLVELHDGKIWVSSKVGKGSTFSFSIPLSKL